MKFAITAATGNIGTPTAKALLAAGHQVVVIGRSAERLAPLVALGAIPAVGDQRDVTFLTEAFQGADAIFGLVPPSYEDRVFYEYQVEASDALLAATRKANVKHAVIISSLGAHLRKGAGVVDGVGYLEEIFSGSGVNTLSLRAGFFFQNLYNNLGLVKQAGILVTGTISPEVKLAMVSTDDIAAVAAERLSALDFTGFSYTYVVGPADLTFPEVGAILAKALGQDHIPYVVADKKEFETNMVGYGLPRSFVEGYLNFFDCVNSGNLNGDYDRSQVKATPTTLEQFATERLLPVYQSL